MPLTCRRRPCQRSDISFRHAPRHTADSFGNGSCPLRSSCRTWRPTVYHDVCHCSAEWFFFCVRMSRYRRNDGAVYCDETPSTSIPVWCGHDEPKIFRQSSSGDVLVDIPPYTLRRIMAARDPLAVMANFTFSIKYFLHASLDCRCAAISAV